MNDRLEDPQWVKDLLDEGVPVSGEEQELQNLRRSIVLFQNFLAKELGIEEAKQLLDKFMSKLER